MKTIVTTACLVGLASAVGAQPLIVQAPEVRSQTVSFADLNLASDGGVSILKSRIRAAANSVCVNSNVDLLTSNLDTMACHHRAVADGDQQLERIRVAQRSGASMAAASITITQ